mgnify:CR=1 FL=1
MATAAEFLDQQDAGEFLDAEDDAPAAPEAPEAPEPPEPEDKPAALMGMLSEFGAALDEIANALHEGKRSSRDIGDTLAQLLEVIRAKDGAGSLAAMTKAIKGLRAVTVNVSPTPVTIEAPAVQVIERATPAEYEISFDYDEDDRIKGARLVPVVAKTKKPEPAGPRVIWPGDHKTAD